MGFSQAIQAVGPVATVIAALVAGFFALWGHINARLMAKLNADVARENAKLNADMLRENTKLASEISRKNAELQAALQANVTLAEFRQKWIDGLRDDMSRFQAIGAVPTGNPTEREEFYELGTRIELRMNPEDEDYNELQDALYGYYAPYDETDKLQANAPFITVCQKILKREWDVLKKDVRRLDLTEKPDE